MYIKTVSILLLTLACLSAAGARADTPIYKWVDDQGKVHYSTEPHGDQAKALAIQNTATPHAGTDVTPVPGASTNTVANDASLTHAAAADTPECKAGRDRLFKYLHADKLYSTDDKGNKKTLSAADKQQALDEARNYVKQACGGGA